MHRARDGAAHRADFSVFIDDDLGFARMPLLFARIMRFLGGIVTGTFDGLFGGVDNRQQVRVIAKNLFTLVSAKSG